jgi:hypothetical protein
MLSLLYWCEGSKNDRRVVFMNSDPLLVKAYLKLLRAAFSINEEKIRAVLHLHEYHNIKKAIKYWSKITKIKTNNFFIYHKNNSGKRKKTNYYGCLSIRYGDSKILDEILLIIRRFSEII